MLPGRQLTCVRWPCIPTPAHPCRRQRWECSALALASPLALAAGCLTALRTASKLNARRWRAALCRAWAGAALRSWCGEMASTAGCDQGSSSRAAQALTRWGLSTQLWGFGAAVWALICGQGAWCDGMACCCICPAGPPDWSTFCLPLPLRFHCTAIHCTAAVPDCLPRQLPTANDIPVDFRVTLLRNNLTHAFSFHPTPHTADPHRQ